MSVRYVDVCADGTRVEGDGLRELYVSAERWPDGSGGGWSGGARVGLSW